jgi:hypothetical protein
MTKPPQLPKPAKSGHVTPDDDQSPKSAKTKQRTTLVTKKTGATKQG